MKLELDSTLSSCRRTSCTSTAISSRRDCDCCQEGGETATVIRFIFVCTHTSNNPLSCSRTNRHIVASCRPLLPIQCYGISFAARSAETNIKKRVRGEIGTRYFYRERPTGRNIRCVKSQVGNDWRGHQRRWDIKFGTGARAGPSD